MSKKDKKKDNNKGKDKNKDKKDKSSGSTSQLASDCTSQISCLQLVVTQFPKLDKQGNVQYRMCLSWNSDLSDCRKSSGDTFAKACPTDDADDVIMNWNSGSNEAMCKLASCDGVAEFGINDGKNCKAKSGLESQLPSGSYSERVRCYKGGYCGSRRDKSCRWEVDAPSCGGSNALNLANENIDLPDDATPKGSDFWMDVFIWGGVTAILFIMIGVALYCYKIHQKIGEQIKFEKDITKYEALVGVEQME
eukprot:439473_1